MPQEADLDRRLRAIEDEQRAIRSDLRAVVGRIDAVIDRLDRLGERVEMLLPDAVFGLVASPPSEEDGG